MGLFTEVTHPGGVLQIKTGFDGFNDWKKTIGDPIPRDWTWPGDGNTAADFEGAHLGLYGDWEKREFGQAWVVVKNGKIHAVEECRVPGSNGYTEGMSEDYARVCDLHGVPKNDPSYAEPAEAAGRNR